MKIKLFIIYILIIILNNFISLINCQCNIGFSKTDYGCNDNTGFRGLYATNCVGSETGYIGSVLIRLSEGAQPTCPSAGNPLSTTAYLPYGYSSTNQFINNQITFTLCYSNNNNTNLYYIGSECLSSNENKISNVTINLNGYLYVGSCTNKYSVFKSYSDAGELDYLRNTECSNTFSGSSEISYNSIYYGDIECPNCNGNGVCSNETNYNCKCDKMYSFDEFCRYNYCNQPSYPCNKAKCNSTSIECYCDPGYSLNPISNECSDINECIIDTSNNSNNSSSNNSNNNKYPCLKNYICINKIGSYDCECPYNSTLNNSNQPCQLKCLSNCGGENQGTCINGVCQCKAGFSGVDCLDISLVTNNTKPSINSTSPSVIFKPENQTLQSIIFIKEIIEIDIYNSVVKQFSLDSIKWIYENITTQSSIESYSYNTTINSDGVETNIKVLLQWFKDYQQAQNTSTLEFANQDLVINPYSLKFNIELSKYNFKSQLSSLQLVIGTSMSNDQASCSSYSIDQSNYDSDYFTLNVDDKSFQCRLLKRGIVDNQVRILTNSFKYLSSDNNSTHSSLSLVTNIPYYTDSIILDPDFGLILKSNNDQDNQNFGKICNNSNGLSRNQLIGIIIGSCVGFILLILLSIIIFKKSHLLRSTKVAIKLREIF